jgi:RimJ/RimL family protein N-acetyltransferase
MTIRKTTMSDLEALIEIYAEAREFMRENGNPDQWKDGYPPRDVIERDISTGGARVCVENGKITAAFYFAVERDPTYEKIDGAWLDDGPYGVVHRVARRRAAKGAGEFILNWCFERCGNIRIDTHKDNAPMRKLLEKSGFEYCGIIRILNGSERMAFQRRAK